MNSKSKYLKYKKKYLDLKKSIGGMNLVANVEKLSSNSSSPVATGPISGSVNTDQVQDIVNYMLDDCGQKLMGYPRGDYNLPGDFINNYMFKDVGPSWACNKPISNLEEKLGDLLGQGMVCIGLLTVVFTHLSRSKLIHSDMGNDYIKQKFTMNRNLGLLGLSLIIVIIGFN